MELLQALLLSVVFLSFVLRAGSCPPENIPVFQDTSPRDRLDGPVYAIVPSYTFTCHGNITLWGACLQPGGGAEEQYDIDFRVFRPSSDGVGCYDLIGSNFLDDGDPDDTGDLDHCLVLTDIPPEDQIQVQPGDVVGFFAIQYKNGDQRNGGIQLDLDIDTVTVWNTEILTIIDQNTCPYHIGGDGNLDSSSTGAPVITAEVGTSSIVTPEATPQPSITLQTPQPSITLQTPQPSITLQTPQPSITLQTPQPSITLQTPQPSITLQTPQPSNIPGMDVGGGGSKSGGGDGGAVAAAVIVPLLVISLAVAVTVVVIFLVVRYRRTKSVNVQSGPKSFENAIYAVPEETPLKSIDTHEYEQQDDIEQHDYAMPDQQTYSKEEEAYAQPEPNPYSYPVHTFGRNENPYTYPVHTFGRKEHAGGIDPYASMEVTPSMTLVSNHKKSASDEDIYMVPASDEHSLYDQIRRINIAQIQRNAVTTTDHLGSGQYGTVDRGVWKSPNGPVDVAVKTLKSCSGQDDKVKFLQEAAIMGQFLHPNVVKLFGVVISGEPKMIILELLAKGDLRQHLISMRPEDGETIDEELPHTLLSYCRQIASGMNYLSNKAFVHRDLAARNILVSEDAGTCKIADFGMSRDLMDESYYVAHGGKIPVKWTSPEALNFKKYSTASDVWSYGAVLYEMWSLGHKPFEGYSNAQAMSMLDGGIRLPPPPGCPRAIYELMIKCWHPVASQRLDFATIVQSLSRSDPKLLKWSEEDKTAHPEATMLGAELNISVEMFRELQNTYNH